MTVRSISTITLAVLTLGNACLWTTSRVLQTKADLANGFEVRFRPQSGIPYGYRPDASPYAEGRKSGCALVRYVAAGCRYCVNDKSHWNTLASRATQSNCTIVGVVPDAASIMPPSSYGQGGEAQLTFMPIDWVADSPPSRTPTTMIFGNGGKLIWQHVGVLSDEAVRSGLAFFPSAGKVDTN